MRKNLFLINCFFLFSGYLREIFFFKDLSCHPFSCSVSYPTQHTHTHAVDVRNTIQQTNQTNRQQQKDKTFTAIQTHANILIVMVFASLKKALV